MGAPFPASMTFDVEDWFHSEINPVRDARPEESIVEAGTTAILDLLARHHVRSTFFVLGDVVRSHPRLVQRLVAEGHELASHGMSHRPLWRATPASFRDELREFRAVVESALGHFPVKGFRAPTFSIDRSNPWALEVLRSEGYRYDSSLFPTRVRMYGEPRAALGIWRPAVDDAWRHDPGGSLVEFPVAVAAPAGLRVPVAGGFYLRALPFALFEAGLDAVLRERPASLYLHPREVVPERRRVSMSPGYRFITYTGLDRVVPRLERLLARRRWTTMRDILAEGGWLND